jgi:soluble lytic murein transglycosylase
VAGLLTSHIPASARAADKKPFQQRWLVPYLTEGRARAARDALVAQQPARASRLLRRYLARKGAPHRKQARFLLAHALMESKEWAAAEEILAQLVSSYPLLVDYHRYHRARALYRLRRFAEAAAAAGSVPEGALLWLDAQIVRADALEAQQDLDEAAAVWKTYLERRPRGGLAGKAHLTIGRALEKRARGGAKAAGELKKQALEHYKQVLIKAPLWRRAPEARKRLKRMIRAVPEGAQLAELSPWQAYSRAMQIFRDKRHEQAEKELTALLKRSGLSPKLTCKASYYQALSVFRQRERARSVPLYTAAERACRTAKKPDLVVKSLYNGARGLMRRHDFTEAIARFGQIEKEFASHSYADDARLLAAEAYEVMKGHEDDVERLLSTLPKHYPDGDMAREALWRLSRRAIIEGKHELALARLDRMLELGRADIYYAHGQALYWKARTLDRKGRRDQARESYERCIREYPLSYYALIAFNRLRERHRGLYRKLYQELIASVGRGPGPWSFPARALYAEPAFQRGVELARLGFGEDAARELASAGLRLRRGAPTEDLWLAAVLFDRAGLWHQSHFVPRALEKGYRERYPLGENYRHWRLSYPRAFAPLVQRNSARAGLDPALVLAIMREESGFAPQIESWANAVGLMQLLVPTAKKAGSVHRMEVTRRRLQDPAVNIKVGTTYLGFLYRSFGKTPPLAISGYNAGEGAVLRWVRSMQDEPLDEFVDRIPYDQTRHYTKRVLSSLFTYSVLYGPRGARVPRIGLKIPRPSLESFGKRTGKRKARRKARKRRKR